MTFTETRVVNQPIETNPEMIELTDKNGKTTATVLFPVIKSVEENKDTLRRGMEVQKDNWNLQSREWSV